MLGDDDDDDSYIIDAPLDQLKNPPTKDHKTRSSNNSVVAPPKEVAVEEEGGAAETTKEVATSGPNAADAQGTDDDVAAESDDDPDERSDITSAKQIKGFRYYNGEEIVQTMDELEKLIAENKADPTKGVPEQLFWVGYKIGKNPDQQVHWTAIVMDNKRRFLDAWIKKRNVKKAPSTKEYFPREVEDYAMKVYKDNREENAAKHRALAKTLQTQWN